MSATPDMDISYVVFKSLVGSKVPVVKLPASWKKESELPWRRSALSPEPGP